MKSKGDRDFNIRGKYIFLILMVGELVYCNYYNFTVKDLYRTEAMTAGLLLGLLFGANPGKIRSVMIGFVCLISIFTLFYAPWSSEWQLYQGVKYHEAGNYSRAEMYYHKVLEMDKSNSAAKRNLVLLKIDDLKEQAYQAHLHKKYTLAREIYRQILSLDPNDVWAKENLEELN